MGKEKTFNLTADEIMAIPSVQGTATWNPVHHSKVIDCVDYAIREAGLAVKKYQFDVTKNGKDLFAVAHLVNGMDARPWSVGFRNSMQKTFAVGLCSGNCVVVCGNLCFSGTFVEFRKHTSGLDMDRLNEMAKNAVSQIIGQCKEFDEWFGKLANFSLPQAHFKALTFNAMESGAIAPSEFKEFVAAYEVEKTVNDRVGTLQDFHGAATRIMRRKSLFITQDRSKQINGTCNEYMTLIEGI